MDKDLTKNRIVILILGVATVLIALVGATFAYFTSIIKKTNDDQSVIVSTVKLEGIEYNASDPLKLIDVQPPRDGSCVSATTKFTIHNPNASATIKYGLKFVPDVNDFELITTDDGKDHSRQLLVKVSGGKLLEEGITFDYTDKTKSETQIITDNVEITHGDSHDYNISIEFCDIGIPQDENQGKNFVGHVEATQSIETAVPEKK